MPRIAPLLFRLVATACGFPRPTVTVVANVTPVYAPAAGAASTRQTGALGAAALSRQALVVDSPRNRTLVKIA